MDGVSVADQTLVLRYEQDKKSYVLNKRFYVRAHVTYVMSTHRKMGDQKACSTTDSNSTVMMSVNEKCMYSIHFGKGFQVSVR